MMEYESSWEAWLGGLLFLVVGFMVVLAWSETWSKAWLMKLEQRGVKRWILITGLLLTPSATVIDLMDELYGPYSVQMGSMLLLELCLTVGLVWFICGDDDSTGYDPDGSD